MPALGWEAIGSAGANADWDKMVGSATEALGKHLRAATDGLGVQATPRCGCGRPAAVLMEAGQDADLIIIGSRRWGPVARLLLGSTGEALLHGATCPVLVVARPADRASPEPAIEKVGQVLKDRADRPIAAHDQMPLGRDLVECLPALRLPLNDLERRV